MDAKELIDKLVRKKTKLKEVELDVPFRELGVDSLDIVDIVLTVEDKLKINFDEQELLQLETLQELYDYTNSKLLEKENNGN